MESKIENENGESSETIDIGQNAEDEHDTKPFIVGQRETIIVRMATEKDKIYYNMTHKNRGMAIIFNHKYFDQQLLGTRYGTDVDCSVLKGVLKNKFRFKVTVCQNYTEKKIIEKLRDIAAMDHSDSDCIIICVLSHGGEGMIYSKDVSYKVNLLWKDLTADKCPSLAGKPKLFFIQACQGEKVDTGVLVKRTESDCDSSYWLPAEADFLIGYSTVPGYLSWRNRTEGSWYIQSLVSLLTDQGTEIDLVTLLTLVNQRVALDCSSNVPQDPNMDKKKQIPSFTSRLTRLLIFDKK